MCSCNSVIVTILANYEMGVFTRLIQNLNNLANVEEAAFLRIVVVIHKVIDMIVNALVNKTTF